MKRVVLGFDPATTASGWAVLILGTDRDRVDCSGTYHAPGQGRLQALAAIYEMAWRLVTKWYPSVVAVETVFSGPNAQTTIRLAEVGAVVRLAAAHAQVEVLDVSPAERCQALGLAPRSSKAEVQRAVETLYGVAVDDHNAADAVAIAVAGANAVRREQVYRGRR